jgi:uncharacterized protein YdeI (BOF family)
MNEIVISMATLLLVLTVAPRVGLAAPPPSPSTMTQQAKSNTQTVTGTIIKNGEKFVLSDAADKLNYVLDDAEKASMYLGKKVKVTGTVDVASNTIHVETIQEIA